MIEGHDELCYYCGQACNSLAGNPSMWPIPLCHEEDPGRVKWHHIGCVDARLSKLQKLEEHIATANTAAELDLNYMRKITKNWSL